MKILHIHPSMGGGGIEAMICALVNEMSKSNDVTLCTIYSPKKMMSLSKNYLLQYTVSL